MIELARQSGGSISTEAIYQALRGVDPGGKRQREAIPGALRASVSRSIRRLAAKGIVKPWPRGGFDLVRR